MADFGVSTEQIQSTLSSIDLTKVVGVLESGLEGLLGILSDLVFILALYALVLAHTDARRGRLSNLFAAILVYLIYSNLLGLGQTLLKKGQVPPGVGLWWLHAGMLLVAIYLLRQRARNRPLIPLPRWRR